MSIIQSTISQHNGRTSILVVVPGDKDSPFVADEGHPNWERILIAAETKDPRIVDLLNPARTVVEKLKRFGRRVTHRDGRIVVDGAEVHNSITKQILRFIEEGVDDWKPLVAFLERVIANPSDHSRTQMYDWLNRHDFTITDEGMIVGYKGVRYDLKSSTAGPGQVTYPDGRVERFSNAHLPNDPGNVVSIDESRVVCDPGVGCASGLHVGNYRYARNFASVLLEVHVDPADVRSVPTDSNWEKVRCTRYRVIRPIKDRYEQAVVPARQPWSQSTGLVRNAPVSSRQALGLAPVDTAGEYDHAPLTEGEATADQAQGLLPAANPNDLRDGSGECVNGVVDGVECEGCEECSPEVYECYNCEDTGCGDCEIADDDDVYAD